MKKYSFKEKIGCLLLDLPRLLPALFIPNKWILASNRKERLIVAKEGVDTTQLGTWSSDIYACHVFPWLGKRLMNQAMKQWPIRFTPSKLFSGKPEISFIVPHRGRDRLAQLKLVVASILAQESAHIECIVVEQSQKSEVEGLPNGVRHIHLPYPEDDNGWRKSWAFNAGVEAAIADIVVCHDGDILVPARYSAEILKRSKDEHLGVLHLQRFLFCLNCRDTAEVISNGKIKTNRFPERVRQNWQGGTVAIRKDAFSQIGGYDERFVGWGGEDNEFFDRCRTMDGWRSGYLPFLHLWHPPQMEKASEESRRNLDLMNDLLRQPLQDRIALLKKRQQLGSDQKIQ